MRLTPSSRHVSEKNGKPRICSFEHASHGTDVLPTATVVPISRVALRVGLGGNRTVFVERSW